MPTEWKRAGRAFLILGGLLFGLWASLPFGSILYHRDVAQAQAFCEGLIPEIERIKVQTGRYPATPPGIDLGVAWPQLLDKESFYRADAEGYGFHFLDRGSLFGGWEYDDRSGRWQQWD